MAGILGDLKAYLAEKLDAHITSNNKSKKQKFNIKAKSKGDVTQNVVVFNIAPASAEEQKEIVAELADKFNQGQLLYVDDDAKKLVESVKAAENDSDNGKIVAYFKDKLTPNDWHILRTGLYTSYLREKGLDVSEIRHSVIENYGIRGKNIMNLAASSPSHFNTHIQPLYEELSKSSDFDNSVFYVEFEQILKEMPFAIFVNSTMSSSKLKEMIEERVEQVKNYAVEKRKIYLHAWGPHVRTVKECVEGLDDSFKVTSSSRKEVTEVIDVTIEF